MHALSLYELNSIVSEVIQTTMSRSYWVEAEVSEARERNGHLYLELIQKEEGTNTPIARASAKCWRSSWSLIGPHFERVAGLQVRAGLQLMVQVHAQFHPQFGFSWIVDDINPEYTMGDMARKRQEIIRQLKDEGVFSLQKELKVPMFAQRIAVISSASAAGYGDFCNQLSGNDYGFAFSIELFPATMQGEQVEQSVISALDAINAEEDAFDCVVIIRGGGATADLSGFDTLLLAENVANFPLPIITGIGHERDESILDMISNTRVKTPTAAAAFLVDNLANTLGRIEDAQASASRYVQNRMQMEKMRLQRLSTGITMQFSMMKTRQEGMLDARFARLSQQISEALSEKWLRLEMISNRLPPLADRKLTAEKHRMELLAQRVESVDPKRLLRLGYSITYHNGRAVKDLKELSVGDELTTMVENGIIKSAVTENVISKRKRKA